MCDTVLTAKHAEPPGEFSWGIRLDGFLVTAGRRRALLVANLAAALALALAARRRLVRRGAERWRRRTWTLAIAALGPIAALAFVAIEPQAARATSRCEAALPCAPAARRSGALFEAARP